MEGCDVAANGRSEDRADQRRDRQPGQRTDHLGLGHGTQENQAADRDHHGATDPLRRASDYQFSQRIRHGGAEGGRYEYADRDLEHRSCTVTVRAPPAQRNEYRERKEIAGQRQFEDNRIFAEVGCNGRQRRGDDA